MKIISFIEDEEVIEEILKHLGIWDMNPPYLQRVKARPPPKTYNAPPKIVEQNIDYCEDFAIEERPNMA